MPRSGRLRGHRTSQGSTGSTSSCAGSRYTETKRRLINRCLEQEPVDVESLRRLAISPEGLLNDGIRRKAWPKLVGTSVYELPELPTADELQAHPDYNQVQLDIQRCFKRFPQDTRKSQCRRVQAELSDLVLTCLHLCPDSHYYQGFHDIAVLWLLVVGPDAALVLMLKLTKCHLSDFMDKDMQRTTSMMTFIYTIIRREDQDLETFLVRSEVGTVFCLSWTITWFTHVLENTADVTRLQDLFLATHPSMPLYLCAAVVLYRRDEVLACECELSAVHFLLSRLPQDLPMEVLVTYALTLYHKCPPSTFDITKARYSYSFSAYRVFEACLWEQPSDLSLSKDMWKRAERERKDELRQLTTSSADSGDAGGDKSRRYAVVPAGGVGGDGAAGVRAGIAEQAKQLAVLGVTATVGIASAVLFSLGRDALESVWF